MCKQPLGSLFNTFTQVSGADIMFTDSVLCMYVNCLISEESDMAVKWRSYIPKVIALNLERDKNSLRDLYVRSISRRIPWQ